MVMFYMRTIYNTFCFRSLVPIRMTDASLPLAYRGNSLNDYGSLGFGKVGKVRAVVSLKQNKVSKNIVKSCLACTGNEAGIETIGCFMGASLRFIRQNSCSLRTVTAIFQT